MNNLSTRRKHKTGTEPLWIGAQQSGSHRGFVGTGRPGSSQEDLAISPNSSLQGAGDGARGAGQIIQFITFRQNAGGAQDCAVKRSQGQIRLADVAGGAKLKRSGELSVKGAVRRIGRDAQIKN